MSKLSTTSKVSYLDGLRGVAALFVFFHHFSLVFYTATYTFDKSVQHLPNDWEVRFGQSIWSCVINGNFCVNIFFVLSGFVLSRKYFHTAAFKDILSGAHRRYLRLNIPVATTVILAYLIMQAGWFFNGPVSKITHSEWWFEGMWTAPVSFQNLLAHIFYRPIFLGDSAMNTVLWTMTVEFYGSMFVFSFLALTHDTRNRLAVLLLVIVYCYIAQSINTLAFTLGISLCYVERRVKARPRKIKNFYSVLLIALGAIMGSFPTTSVRTGTFFEHLGHTLLEYTMWYHQVGAYCLVLAFVISPSFQKIISMRFFRFLGYISFCLYLLHVIVIASIGSYLFLLLNKTLSYNYSVMVVLAACSASVFFLAWLMTKYVDTPGIKLAKYVYQRWAAKPGTAATD